MKVYELLWILLRHALAGRFRDEVMLSVELKTERRELGLVGPMVSFEPVARQERFCALNAVSEDPEPWSEWPSIEDLIDASSLGTPDAKVLRQIVPDEVVDRIMGRYREIRDNEGMYAEAEAILCRYDAYEFTDAEAIAQLCRAMPGCTAEGARSLLRPRASRP